jgi:glycosyltransferase involved in cell wall biosynthesis
LKKKGISIIICCYNSALLLEPTLYHIAQLNLDENLGYEIILVDNGSTDNTQKTAEEIWSKIGSKEIDMVFEYELTPGLTAAREKGLNAARYDYLVFCDDDNWLNENYLKNVNELFDQNQNAAILGGAGIPVFEHEDLKPLWFDSFHHSFAVGFQNNIQCSATNVYGAGMAVRKSVLKELVSDSTMFLLGRRQNQLTAGEDSEICYKVILAGYQIIFSPNLTFQHFLPAQRLTWEHVKKLHIGFAQSHVILNLYQKAITAPSSKLPYFYWLKKLLYYWGIYIKYWPKHYLSYQYGEGTTQEIHHITWKNIALAYLYSNFKTMNIYRKIVMQKKI